MTTGSGTPTETSGNYGDIYLDTTSNTVWVKYAHGWCDVVNGRHISELGSGLYSTLPQMQPKPIAVTPLENQQPNKSRVFTFD